MVQTMGKTYHQKCFTCNKCNQPFQSGAKVNTIFDILFFLHVVLNIFINEIINGFAKGNQHW